MTLDQLISDVTRAAEAVLAVQPEHGDRIDLIFHNVDASPVDAADHLAKVLPGWPPARITAHQRGTSYPDWDVAYLEIELQKVRIIAWVTEPQATAYLAALPVDKAA